jgi:hypothetical protein
VWFLHSSELRLSCGVLAYLWSGYVNRLHSVWVEHVSIKGAWRTLNVVQGVLESGGSTLELERLSGDQRILILAWSSLLYMATYHNRATPELKISANCIHVPMTRQNIAAPPLLSSWNDAQTSLLLAWTRASGITPWSASAYGYLMGKSNLVMNYGMSYLFFLVSGKNTRWYIS